MYDKPIISSLTASGPTTRLSGGVFSPIFCIISMSSVQLGGVLSKSVLIEYGAISTTWLRLCVAALILFAIVRPSFRFWNCRRWCISIALGVSMAGMTLCYFGSILYVPLGLAVAINFMGPLAVSVFSVRHARMLVWPIVAVSGVITLARHNGAWAVDDLQTLFFPVGAAICWAFYIILMKHTGKQSEGMDGLSASLIVAALVITPFGFIQSGGHIAGAQILDAAWLTLLMPLIPYVLELTALRHMTSSSFGILMSAEPAIAAVAGYLFLSQSLEILQILGVFCVVCASAGAVLQK